MQNKSCVFGSLGSINEGLSEHDAIIEMVSMVIALIVGLLFRLKILIGK